MSELSPSLAAKAAEAYSPTRNFPISDEAYRLELEIAFIKGADWYIGQVQQGLNERMKSIKSELSKREVSDAR